MNNGFSKILNNEYINTKLVVNKNYKLNVNDFLMLDYFMKNINDSLIVDIYMTDNYHPFKFNSISVETSNFYQVIYFLDNLSVLVFLKYMAEQLSINLEKDISKEFYQELLKNNNYNFSNLVKILNQNKNTLTSIKQIRIYLNQFLYSNNELDLDAFTKFNIYNKINLYFSDLEKLIPTFYNKYNLSNINDISFDKPTFLDFINLLKDLDIYDETLDFNKNIYHEKNSYKFMYKASQIFIGNKFNDYTSLYQKIDFNQKLIFLEYITQLSLFNDLPIINNFEIVDKLSKIYNIDENQFLNFNIVASTDMFRVKMMPYIILDKLTDINYIEKNILNKKKLKFENIDIKMNNDSLNMFIDNQLINIQEELKSNFDIYYDSLEFNLRSLFILNKSDFNKIVDFKKQEDTKLLKELGIKENLNKNEIENLEYIKSFENLPKEKIEDYLKDEVKVLESLLNIDNQNWLNSKKDLNVFIAFFQLLVIFSNINSININKNVPEQIRLIIKDIAIDYNIPCN